MILSIGALALFVATGSVSAFGAVTAGRGGAGRGGAGRGRGGAGRGTMPTMAGVDPAHLCPTTGLIKSWKAASQEDTDMLKQLVEEGFVDGYRTQDIKDEHPRHNRFTNKCLGDKVSNLRRTLRDNIERRAQMDASGGGGQGLPAEDSYVPPIEQPRSNYYIDDEAEGWPNENQEDDITETMSRMTVDDDASFASHSVTNQTRGGVSFVSGAGRGRPGGSVSGGSVRSRSGGLAVPRPGGILRNAGATSRRGTRTAGTVEFNGGSVCCYSQLKWVDEHTTKRWSLHIHMISGSTVPMHTTARVTEDQRHLLVQVPLSECFLDPDRGLYYLFDRVKKAHPWVNDMDKFREFMKNHPRHIAMKKNILKLRANSPDADQVMFPVRISLGGKVSFDFVNIGEDPICFGKEFIVDHLTGECHYYIELKEAKTNGFSGPQADYAGDIRSPEPPTAVRNTRDMESIPEEVSIDSRGSNSYMRGLNNRLDEANYRHFHGSQASTCSAPSVMSVDSRSRFGGNRDDADFDEYLEGVEHDLMTEINKRRNGDGASVYTDCSSVRRLKSPRKKSRATEGEEFTFEQEAEEDKKPRAKRTDLTVAVSVKGSKKNRSSSASVASVSSRRDTLNTVTPNGNVVRHRYLPTNSNGTPAVARAPSAAASVATTATGRPKRKASEKPKKHGSGNNSDDYTV